jgi:hypothetical protein
MCLPLGFDSHGYGILFPDIRSTQQCFDGHARVTELLLLL